MDRRSFLSETLSAASGALLATVTLGKGLDAPQAIPEQKKGHPDGFHFRNNETEIWKGDKPCCRILKPSQADYDRARELAEIYGW